jgi:short-subunit dehydrogenase
MQTVLITGASTGIGFELAKLFARDKYKLVLSANNQARLTACAERIAAEYDVPVEAIAQNLAKPGAAKKLVDEINKRNLDIDVLVNNAGFGVLGLFARTEVGRETELLQVNVVALTELTKLLVPGMVERQSGKILNVGSTAGFVPGPGMAVYYASKAYVLSFSEALANELHGTGVTVTVLCPGPTRTEFQARAGITDSRLFNLMKPMSAARAAKKGYLAMLRGQTVVIPGLTNKAMAGFSRLVPRELIPQVVRLINEP